MTVPTIGRGEILSLSSSAKAGREEESSRFGKREEKKKDPVDTAGGRAIVQEGTPVSPCWGRKGRTLQANNHKENGSVMQTIGRKEKTSILNTECTTKLSKKR